MLENKECVPFEDMTAEEQGIIINAIKNGVKIEECYGKGSGWFYPVLKGISLKSSYRVIPKRLSIPWYALKKELCYAVMMKDKSIWLSDKPFSWEESSTTWLYAENSMRCIVDFLNVNTDGIDYKTSQVGRFN